MKLKLLILILISHTFMVGLTLPECLEKLEKNYPTSGNEQIYTAICEQEIARLNNSWLPQLFITGAASYSSETTAIQLDLPAALAVDFPEADQDRGMISLEVSQKVFDAGINAKQKEQRKLQNLIEITWHQASMHQKKMLTSSLYLNVVLLEKTSEIIELQMTELEITLKTMKARLDEGLQEKIDVQKLQYEILNLQDKWEEIRSMRASMIDHLSLLTGSQIDENEKFSIPAEPENQNAGIKRWELQGFDLQMKLLSESQKLNSRSLWPQLFAGGNLSYGKPGYDIFSDEYHEFYSVALNLRWQIWDFGKIYKQNRIYSLQEKIIRNQKAEFELDLRAKLTENSRRIYLLKERLKRSRQKVDLMSEIVKSVKAKLAKGLVSSDDFLLQSNQLLKTKTELEQDRLNLLNAEIQNVLLRGGEI